MSSVPIVEKKGGQLVKGTPEVSAAVPVVAVVEPVGGSFDRRVYQREYMRRYRAEGRDRPRKSYKGVA